MKPTLLIAEGDAELCLVYQKFLSESGYEVETALDGLECLAKLRRARPAVLVLDRELLWGGGDGVLAWLREQNAASEFAVVLTCTAGVSVNVVEDIKPPVVKFLPKPFTLADLLDCVQTAMGQRDREEVFYRSLAPRYTELYIG